MTGRATHMMGLTSREKEQKRNWVQAGRAGSLQRELTAAFGAVGVQVDGPGWDTVNEGACRGAWARRERCRPPCLLPPC